MKLNNYLVVILMLMTTSSLTAQINYEGGGVGKGIRFKTNDDSFYLKYRTRIQTRWDFEQTPDLNLSQNKAFVKRARLKFDGYFINKDLRYKIEYDVVGGYVRDAMIKYRMGNFDLWFGQGKLPGNRERVTSSANLQLVDRSVYNKYYNLDRDIGLQLHHSFYLGSVFIRDIYAVTTGNGILDNKMAGGVALSGKLEVLPFGKFTKKGDYIMADIHREEKPKLSLAAYASYNVSAYKDRGQTGSDMGTEKNLLTLGFDALFKYRGYSLMLELGGRNATEGSELVYDDNGDAVDSYYTGQGINIQTGYVFKNMWELSGRYSTTSPDQIDYNTPMQDHTLGVSKYIIGHAFKVQSDVTYRAKDGGSDMYIFRMQVEFQF